MSVWPVRALIPPLAPLSVTQVRLLESSPSMPYHFFAHSAGAQLLHRLLLFRPDPAASSIVVANSGSYTFPDLSWDFPYGLRGLPPEFRKGSVLPSLLKAFVEAPLTLAIGTEDVLTTGQHMDMSKVGTMAVPHWGMRLKWCHGHASLHTITPPTLLNIHVTHAMKGRYVHNYLNPCVCLDAACHERGRQQAGEGTGEAYC